MRWLIFSSILIATPAAAGELDLALGANGAATSWDDDGAVYSSLRLGWRLRPRIAIHFLGQLGYGAVDDRMLTYLSAGGQVWGQLGRARPWARAGLVHQHEESRAAIDADPVGALFGVGDGIRHRAGLGGGLGVDLPLRPTRRGEIYLSAEATATWFPDERGPGWYLGGGLAVGLRHSL